MTMPHLMNCQHSTDGWCLECVKELQEERDDLEDELGKAMSVVYASEEFLAGNYDEDLFQDAVNKYREVDE